MCKIKFIMLEDNLIKNQQKTLNVSQLNESSWLKIIDSKLCLLNFSVDVLHGNFSLFLIPSSLLSYNKKVLEVSRKLFTRSQEEEKYPRTLFGEELLPLESYV